jgi:4a-hydroxytetrahydrobiopterin dehydratase
MATSRNKLTDPEVAVALDGLNAPLASPWQVVDGALRKGFRFPDFVAAFGFMTRAALVAQSMDHHPDWRNVYDRVEVTLSTHDAGGITALDFELARRMEGLLR